MEPQTTSYRAFLLRVWTQRRGTSTRASVRDVESGETKAFTNLDALHEWLDHEMTADAAADLRSHPSDS
ncbi:MAG: hypothetical protein ABFR89_08185 [Actinomycetota bacterium]